MAAAHVVFRSVAKRFGDGPLVLDGLSLEVAAGEFVSLIGPSGCGKSTLLRLIAALSPVSAGELLVDGRPPARGRRETAFIFQEPTLLPWLNVQSNIEVPLRIAGVARAERRRRAEAMLRLVRLEDVRDLHPRQLSGGMKMRVSVARALVQSPRLLLLDEPFGALDEMTRDRLNLELLRIWEATSATVVFVTHSIFEAVFLSSRVVVMSARPGRVQRIVDVDLPYPRTTETREEVRFFELATEVRELLRESHSGRDGAGEGA